MNFLYQPHDRSNDFPNKTPSLHFGVSVLGVVRRFDFGVVDIVDHYIEEISKT